MRLTKNITLKILKTSSSDTVWSRKRKVMVSDFPHKKKKNAEIASAILTKAGSRMDDNYVIDVDYPDASFTFEKKNMDKVVKLISGGEKNETDKNR